MVLPEGIPEAAVAEALKSLVKQDRFRSELVERIADRGFSADVAHATADLVMGWFGLDDLRVAENAIEAWQRSIPWSKAAIASRLEAKGVPEELIAAALVHTDDRASIETIIEAKTKRGDALPKIGRYLATRGFEEEDIREALESREG